MSSLSIVIQLFAGTDDNPLAFCNDPTIIKAEECVGQFYIKVDAAKEFLSLDAPYLPTIKMLVPRVW